MPTLPGTLYIAACRSLATTSFVKFIRPTMSSSLQYSSMATQSDRGYAHALELLNSIASNKSVTKMLAKSDPDMNRFSLPEMIEYLRRAGYTLDDLKKLKVVHVAGTKGKGSVSAMVAAILQQYKDGMPSDGLVDASQENTVGAQDLGGESSSGEDSGSESSITGESVRSVPPIEMKPLGDIGLYTSPHLITPRERIRINGQPVSQDDFAESFFRLWDNFSKAAQADNDLDPTGGKNKPGYFRYLTIMAFDIFLRKGIRSCVFECGIGGEYDSTNILPPEAVTCTAITKLGIDHVDILGNTVEKIAWHKAGIFKPGVPACTSRQVHEAMEVLKSRAKDKGIKVKRQLAPTKPKTLKKYRKLDLSLEGEFQNDNAYLAIGVANEHLCAMGYGWLVSGTRRPEVFDRALSTLQWQGRCEIKKERGIDWYVDGAHNNDSLEVVATWFAKHMNKQGKKVVLIFNQQIRDGVPLLRQFYSNLIKATGEKMVFDHGIFCSNTVFSSDEAIDLASQKAMAHTWQEVNGGSEGVVVPCIEDAVKHARSLAVDGEEVQVLVTGSLHLVGGLIQVLDGKGKDDLSVR